MLETKSGTATPLRSGSVGNYRTTVKGDVEGPDVSATSSTVQPAKNADGSLGSSLTSSIDSLGGGESTSAPRPGSHTIEFFEIMASFSWKRKIGEKVSKSVVQHFHVEDERSEGDDDEAGRDEEVDWLHATKKRKEMLLEDCAAKSRRLKEQGTMLAEEGRAGS
ncbi:hypothetical protein CHARACLAT_029318 [Characodon lateralis]|uniref:Uncharacterized protein n=1 Tax=Characodon lateralis TaxID=208331 RepID=A0ABU7ENA5_9TELE|nr:hypothetical protein [Characodon lateralis]